MLNVLLLLGIIILVLPWPLGKSLRKFFPLFGLLIVTGIAILTVNSLNQADNYSRVTIEALEEKNAASGGEEVWLMEVTVNDKRVNLEEVFGDSWIKKESALVWRPYNQKDGMTISISAQFEPDDKVQLKFQSNKWRGMARVICGDNADVLDFYTDTDSMDQIITWETVVPQTTDIPRSNINAKSVMLVMICLLVALCFVSCLISHIRNKGEESSKNQRRKRYIWMDMLKVVSAFMIVVIHSAGTVYNNSFGQDAGIWIKALWINAIPRFAVPCFLMITGTLLLGKTYDYDRTLWKKIKRILIPLCFWSVVYVTVRKVLWHGNENIAEEFLKIPFKHQESSLWYAYQLFWIYLGLPIWQRLYDALSEKMRWQFVVFSLGIPGVFTIIGQLIPFTNPQYLPFASIAPMICYVGVLFLGKLLTTLFTKGKSSTRLLESILLIATGLGIMILCSVYSSNSGGGSVHIYFSEVQLPAILYGSGVFMLFQCLGSFFRRFPAQLKIMINEASSVSLGIYLTHRLVLWALPDFTVGGVHIARDSGSIKQLLACVFVCYMISLVGCLMLSKIPGLRRLVL